MSAVSGYDKERERIARCAAAVTYAADEREAYYEHQRREHAARKAAKNWFDWKLFFECGCSIYAPGHSRTMIATPETRT